jgi:hypothetical protein
MRRIEGKPGERAARPRGEAFLNERALDASPVGWANFIEILIVLYRLFRLFAASVDSQTFRALLLWVATPQTAMPRSYACGIGASIQMRTIRNNITAV